MYNNNNTFDQRLATRAFTVSKSLLYWPALSKPYRLTCDACVQSLIPTIRLSITNDQKASLWIHPKSFIVTPRIRNSQLFFFPSIWAVTLEVLAVNIWFLALPIYIYTDGVVCIEKKNTFVHRLYNIYFVQQCWGRLFAYNIQYVVANFRYVS